MTTDNTDHIRGATRDAETGRFDTRYPDAAFLDAVRDAGGMAGTREVEERVGCSYELALKRLKRLEAEGAVTSRDLGRTLLWEMAYE